jgi:pantetheine-phosphate adenylyltransferase
MITNSTAYLQNVKIDSFEGLMVDHAVKHGAVAAIRGLRALSDFEFEFKMALMNRSLNEDISTLFLMPHAKYTHVSSSMVREVASLGGSVSEYVPPHVNEALKEKYTNE